MGAKSKRKGAQGEREWAAYLTAMGFTAHRGRQYSGGPNSPDVVGGIAGTHCEVKRVEKLSIYSAVDQSTGDACDSVPYVAHRRNGRDWLVTIRASDLLDFTAAVERAKKSQQS